VSNLRTALERAIDADALYVVSVRDGSLCAMTIDAWRALPASAHADTITLATLDLAVRRREQVLAKLNRQS